MTDREAEAASAEEMRRLAMADVWRAGKDSPRFRHTSRPAVLTARSTYCVPVGSDEPCPDCDAPGKELCHWYCPRYEDGPDE